MKLREMLGNALVNFADKRLDKQQLAMRKELSGMSQSSQYAASVTGLGISKLPKELMRCVAAVAYKKIRGMGAIIRGQGEAPGMA